MPPSSSINNNEHVTELSQCQLGKESIHCCKSYDSRTSTVSFSGSIEFVTPTLHVDDYTREERCAVWYGVQDFKSIKNSRQDIVRRMQQAGSVIDKANESTRGLEGKTREGGHRRHKDILTAVYAVICEQEVQGLQGVSNPYLLADTYKMHSRQSQMAALKRGLTDQTEVIPFRRASWIEC